MSIQNILLLIAGIINLIMSILVFSRGVKHNKINLYFSLFTFFNFLWAISLLIVNLATNYELTRFFASFVYLLALVIIVNLFYFIVHFPHKLFEVSRVYKFFINLAVVFYSIFCTFFYKIFVYKVVLDNPRIVYFEKWSYLIYAIILTVLMLVSVVILFLKLQKTEGIFRQQLKLMLIAVIIGTVAGGYFNLFFIYFNDLYYNYLGPLFTLVINFVVFYLIFHTKEK